MTAKARLVLLSLACILFISGCDDSRKKFMSQVPGNYLGFVIQDENTPSRQQIAVAAEVTPTENRGLSLHVSATERETTDQLVWDFILHVQKKTVSLSSPSGLFADTIYLRPVSKSKKCYRSADGNLRFCYDGAEIALKYTTVDHSYALILNPIPDQTNRLAAEAPAPYTVSQLVLRGKSQNFASQIQYERWMESRYRSRAAYANMAPHISMGAVTGILNFQLNALVGLISDLAPFLIPANWMNASASKWQSEADFNAWRLMKANTATSVASATYAVLRDEASMAALSAYEEPIANMRTFIEGQEAIMVLPLGSTRVADDLLTNLLEAKRDLNERIASERGELAVAVGMRSVEGIGRIEDDTNLDLPLSANDANTQNVVEARSLELHQLHSLLAAAKDRVRARTFSWASPSGSLSFGLPSEIAAERMNEEGIRTQIAQQRSILSQQTENALRALHTSQAAYIRAQANVVSLNERFVQMQNDMLSGTAFAMETFKAALERQMNSDLAAINMKYTYFMAVDRMNRLQMSGDYEDITTLVSDDSREAR